MIPLSILIGITLLYVVSSLIDSPFYSTATMLLQVLTSEELLLLYWCIMSLGIPKHCGHTDWQQVRSLAILTQYLRRDSLYFMETSALDATNVENASTEVLTQIYWIVSKRAIEAADNGTASTVPSSGQTMKN